jgi:hypothetical protein
MLRRSLLVEDDAVPDYGAITESEPPASDADVKKQFCDLLMSMGFEKGEAHHALVETGFVGVGPALDYIETIRMLRDEEEWMGRQQQGRHREDFALAEAQAAPATAERVSDSASALAGVAVDGVAVSVAVSPEDSPTTEGSDNPPLYRCSSDPVAGLHGGRATMQGEGRQDRQYQARTRPRAGTSFRLYFRLSLPPQNDSSPPQIRLMNHHQVRWPGNT